jgi:hypothetical protein
MLISLCLFIPLLQVWCLQWWHMGFPLEAQSPSSPEHMVRVWAQLYMRVNTTALLYCFPILIEIYSVSCEKLKWKDTCRLHHQGALMMEAASTSETLVNFYFYMVLQPRRQQSSKHLKINLSHAWVVTCHCELK